MKKYIISITFWGAIWGAVEATLGYVLHSFSLGIGWFFWFPLAFFFMDRVFKKTKSRLAVILTSVLAASIKLIDFLLPARVDRIINPAVSIVLEGLIVFLALLIIENRRNLLKNKYTQAIFVSIGWRALYVGYILLMPEAFFNISPLREMAPLLQFLVFESFINSLVIFTYIKLSERVNIKKEGFVTNLSLYLNRNSIESSALSIFLLALALYLQWIL